VQVCEVRKILQFYCGQSLQMGDRSYLEIGDMCFALSGIHRSVSVVAAPKFYWDYFLPSQSLNKCCFTSAFPK